MQRGAGEGSLFADDAYVAAGARIVPDAEAVFAQAELIVKVKEPLPEEIARLEPRHILFTYLHLAPDRELTSGLVASGATCLAYETVETADGRHPLLAPMSEIAGRLAPQIGAYFLERMSGGKGKLWAAPRGQARERGDPGRGHRRAPTRPPSPPAWERGPRSSTSTWRRWAASAGQLPAVETLHSDQLTIEAEVAAADVVIGAVLVSGARTPVLVSENAVRSMQPGSVIVDLSVDQGGCVATSRATIAPRPDLRASTG